jgi:hypothetical protein
VLKGRLRDRGLSTKGSKDTLRLRLLEASAAPAPVAPAGRAADPAAVVALAEHADATAKTAELPTSTTHHKDESIQ